MTPTRRFRVSWLLQIVALLSVALGTGAVERSERPLVVPNTPDGQIPIIIETRSPDNVAALLVQLGGRVDHVFRAIDGLSGAVPAEAFEELGADLRVESVQRQRYVYPAAVPIDRVRLEAAGLRVPRTAEGYFISTPSDRYAVREVVEGVLGGDDDEDPISFIGYEAITEAHLAWEEVGFGDNTATAIIDTGVYPDHPLYRGNVYGGINLVPEDEEKAIDFDGDGLPDGRAFSWDSVHNNPHGTFVAGLVAGHVDLEFDPEDPFVQAIDRYCPECVVFRDDDDDDRDDDEVAVIRLFGPAPRTGIYAIKVFPYDGSGAPDARVVEAIDHIIANNQGPFRPIRVINMSLSGPVLFDGFNPLDGMVAAATAAGITCVSAAANTGPALVSVGSPASAISGLAVGAAVDPIHTRVALETIFGAPPGSGAAFYPEDVLQIANFSARGVTGDGRVKPDLVATGFLVFSSTLDDVTGDGLPDQPGFGWSFGGTSFAAPLVSGAAALVTSDALPRTPFARAPFVGNTLERAAVPIWVFHRVSQREQGFGYVNLPGAIQAMRTGFFWPRGARRQHLSQQKFDLGNGPFTANFPEIRAGHTYTFEIKVRRGTKSIDFTFPQVRLRGPQNPISGDQLGIAIHSAKRGGTGDYVFVEESLTPGDTFTYEDPEPGLVRATFFAGLGNHGKAFATIQAEPTIEFFPARDIFRGLIPRNGHVQHSLDVQPGLAAIGVMLSWKQDWASFPTSDLDLIIQTPDYTKIPVTTLDSPELIWIENPEAGEWWFRIHEMGTAVVDEEYVLKIAYERIESLRDGVVDFARPRLVGAHPNPFSPATDVQFAIPSRGDVSLRVYDVTGRLVRTLVNEPLEAGSHDVQWDGRTERGLSAASGVYFLRLETAEGTSKRKVTRLE